MPTFRDRLARVRAAIVQGPSGLTIKNWAQQAQVAAAMLQAGYACRIRAKNQQAIARAAAALLGVSAELMADWLLHGQEAPVLEARLREIAALAQCARCGGWFPREQILESSRLCRVCNRIKKRIEANPHLDDYHRRVRAALPELRRRDPALAGAIEAALGNPAHAFSYVKVARMLGVSARTVGQRMRELGLARDRHPDHEAP